VVVAPLGGGLVMEPFAAATTKNLDVVAAFRNPLRAWRKG